MHHIDHCHCLRTRSIHQFRQLARPAIASAFSGSAREHYQRDAKDEYACEHSIEWDDNEKESSDSIAFPASLTVAKVGAGHPQRTIGLIPFLRMYIDREECPQAEKTRPLTIVFYRPYNLSDRKESPHHIDFNCRPYQPSILPRYWFITYK